MPLVGGMPEHRNSLGAVIPAKAGIQNDTTGCELDWMPAFAGMTNGRRCHSRKQPVPAKDGEFLGSERRISDSSALRASE